MDELLKTEAGRKVLAKEMADLMKDSMCPQCGARVLGMVGDICTACMPIGAKLVKWRPEGSLLVTEDEILSRD